MHYRTLSVSCHTCEFEGTFHSHLELQQRGFAAFTSREASPPGKPDVAVRCKCGSLDTDAAGVIEPSTTEPITVTPR